MSSEPFMIDSVTPTVCGCGQPIAAHLAVNLCEVAALRARVAALEETLGEITVHEGDPAREAGQMRSAARAAVENARLIDERLSDIRKARDDEREK